MKKELFPAICLILVWMMLFCGVFVLAQYTANPAKAATSQNVDVEAVPNYLAITNSPSTWTLNGITGSGVVDVDTVYYSNPLGDTTTPSATVVDGECRFTITNSSSVDIDYFVNCGSFTGGDATMTNSDDGSNGATTYGGYSWYSGMTYSSKVVMKSTGSSALATSQNGASFKWGAEIETRTNAWTGGSSSNATMTISVQAS